MPNDCIYRTQIAASFVITQARCVVEMGAGGGHVAIFHLRTQFFPREPIAKDTLSTPSSLDMLMDRQLSIGNLYARLEDVCQTESWMRMSPPSEASLVH